MRYIYFYNHKYNYLHSAMLYCRLNSMQQNETDNTLLFIGYFQCWKFSSHRSVVPFY